MKDLRGMIKRVFGEEAHIPRGVSELSLALPRLFVLRPSTGIGLEYTKTLDEIQAQAGEKLSDKAEEQLGEKLFNETSKFSEAQKAEIEEIVDQFSQSTAQFLNKLTQLTVVQSGRITEIEAVRTNLASAVQAESLGETRERLQHGLNGLQKIVEIELQRQSDLCTDREMYAIRLKDRLEVVEKESRTDILTGIANRAGCIKKIEATIDFVRTNSSEFTLSLIDLNGFKQINDTLGHAAGDAALIGFSQRLEAAIGKSNFVGRLAGDEFIVLTNASPSTLASMLARLTEQLVQYPPTYKGLALQVSFCFGMAGVTKSATPSKLLEEADKMLYQNKNTYYASQAA